MSLYSMIDPGRSSRFAAVLLGAALTAAAPLAAQAPQPLEARPTARQDAAAQSQQAAARTGDAEQTRKAFSAVLDQYPTAVGHVLRLDPTLLTNADYLASYPGVAAFIAQHPDIPRNPGFYLARYSLDAYSTQAYDPKLQALAMWDEALEFMGAFAVFGAVVFALFSLLKYVVEYRRWHRISKMNSEVHNKILDRFGSNEELLAYIDSPPGRRFLEATPIAQATPQPARAVGAPLGRILLSVQVGIILVALGIGFLVIAGWAIEEVQPVLTSLAALGFCLGAGAMASAGASYVLSRKLGLLPDEPAPRPQTLL